MKVWKKLAVGLALLLGGCLLFGCSHTESVQTDRITVWVMPGSQPAFFAWAKEAFEDENPGLKVNIVTKSAGDLGDKLDATLSKKSGAPDIAATYGGIIVPVLVKNDRLMDISEFFEDETEGASIESRLNEGALRVKQDGNGKFYSAPLAGSASPVVFYNATLFEQLKSDSSLTEEQKSAVKEPNTYEELKALCDVLRAADKEPIAAGLGGWHLPHLMQPLAARTMTPENYEKLLHKGQDENPFEGEGYKESFDLLKKYYEDGIFSTNASGTDVGSAETMFMQGKSGMYLGISLDYYTLESSMTANIGAFFLPADNPIGADSDNPRASGVYSDCLVVNKNAANVEIVEKFIKFLYTDESQQQLCKVSLLPCVKDTDTALLPEPLVPVWNEMNDNGFVDFYQNWSYPGVDTTLVVAASGALNGDSAQTAEQRMIDFYTESKRAEDLIG